MLFCNASFISLYVSARARRDDTTIVTRFFSSLLFYFLFGTHLRLCFLLASLARFERFFLSIHYRQTDTQTFCVFLSIFLQLQLMFSSRFHVENVRWRRLFRMCW